MPEVRLIDANALIQNHCGACANKEFCSEESCPYYEIRRRIETAPTIEAEPVRHGWWIDWSMWGESHYQCSECNAEMKYKTNFCPRCGAKMQDGGAENG